MTTHGYVRASTNRQKDSPDTQKHTIKEYCLAQKLEPPLYYVDAATSGKIPIGEREAGGDMMRRLKRGDHVVIAKLDRAFRSLKDAVNVLDEMHRMGISIHVCNMMGGALDLTSPIGKFLMHMLAAFAELERAMITERISDGIRAARRRGGGGGCPNWGFKWKKHVRVMPDGSKRSGLIMVRDDHHRKVMGWIVAWRTEGWSYDQIHDKLEYQMKVRTSEDREWTTWRIVAAYKAELILRIGEAAAASGREPCDRESR